MAVATGTMAGRRLVVDLDALRDSFATDVLRDAIRTSLETLVDIKERIKSASEHPGDGRREVAGDCSLQRRMIDTGLSRRPLFLVVILEQFEASFRTVSI